MFWKREIHSYQRLTDSDVRCTLLLAAVRAFREAEAQAAADAASANDLMAEYAELVVLPPAR